MNLAIVAAPARRKLRLVVDPQDPPTLVPASIVITPTPFNVTTGGTAQLTATVYDQFGAVMNGRTVTWASSATGVATVDSAGLVTGVAAGTCTITAADGTDANVSAPSSCTVSAPAVATLAVTPTTATVTEGGASATVTFTPKDAGGNALAGRTVTGTSNAAGTATISLSGYTGTIAPVAAGSTTVYGTCEGVDSPTVAVTVNAAGGGGSSYPNEPAGFTEITTRVWSSSTEDGWSAQTGGTLKSDGTGLPTGLATYIQHNVPNGSTGTSLGTTEKVISSLNKTRLYASLWFKLSAGYQGHSTNTNKLGLWLPAGSTGNSFFLNMKGNGSGTLQAEAYFQGVPTALNGGSNFRRITSSAGLSAKAIARDTWHQWELDYTLNTYDVADGVLKMWFNGVLFISVTDLGVRGTGGEANSPFWRTKWNPIWGGTGTANSSTTQILCAELYVSG